MFKIMQYSLLFPKLSISFILSLSLSLSRSLSLSLSLSALPLLPGRVPDLELDLLPLDLDGLDHEVDADGCPLPGRKHALLTREHVEKTKIISSLVLIKKFNESYKCLTNYKK